MHVASNRLHISQDRVKPFGIHPWFLPPRAQRWVQPPTCASFRQNAVVADVGNTPCDAAASQASATSRRHALSLLAGNAVVLTSNAVGMAAPSTAWAALKDYNLDPNQPIEEVAVQLGTENGQYAFIPSTLEFTAGKIYKLKLRNPSTSTHYFTAFEFAEKVTTSNYGVPVRSLYPSRYLSILRTRSARPGTGSCYMCKRLCTGHRTRIRTPPFSPSNPKWRCAWIRILVTDLRCLKQT
ncbi:hypothetical protein Vretifemale_7606 [Volvox reticuliferus]|nr:hypothetical protein Vretifemale_7606 [Volvox reticuliferus]